MIHLINFVNMETSCVFCVPFTHYTKNSSELCTDCLQLSSSCTRCNTLIRKSEWYSCLDCCLKEINEYNMASDLFSESKRVSSLP